MELSDDLVKKVFDLGKTFAEITKVDIRVDIRENQYLTKADIRKNQYCARNLFAHYFSLRKELGAVVENSSYLKELSDHIQSYYDRNKEIFEAKPAEEPAF